MANVGDHRIRHLSTPEAEPSLWCGPILEALLRPVAGDKASASSTLLLQEFGSVPEVLYAEPGARDRILTDRPLTAELLSAVQEAMIHCLRVRIEERPLLANYDAVVSFMRGRIGFSRREQVMTLYLDTRNHLLASDISDDGTIDQTWFCPREIVRRALQVGAASIIIGHNHPSDDLEPSVADVSATRELIAAARTLRIAVLDHIIVTRRGWRSFRAAGMLPAWERGEAEPDYTSERAAADPNDRLPIELAEKLIVGRTARDRVFGASLFADPAWDILLELFVAEARGRSTRVSAICIASRVPPTTALRWIELLDKGGILARRADPLDKRAINLNLTATAHDAMRRLLHELGNKVLGNSSIK